MEWWSLSRDSFYYILSVLVLIAVLYDGRVYWQEALIMLCIYGFYIAGMVYDTQCKGFVELLLGKLGCSGAGGSSQQPNSPRRLSVVIKTKLKETDEERSPLLNSQSKLIKLHFCLN